jgi:hypothetical protein
MSTTPWGTMNGWLRVEGEQRGAWLTRRVQDLRAAQVVRRPEIAPIAPRETAPRGASPRTPCAEAA